MTAQIQDTFEYEKKAYSLIACEDNLAMPQDFGMEPTEIHSACCRGFYSAYRIEKETLFLVQMTVREVGDNYKPINGIMGESSEDGYAVTYANLNLFVPCCGRIRLARDFIDEFYVHMGYQKPSAYKTVIDFTFDTGRIVSFIDRSKEAEQIRGKFKEEWGKAQGNWDVVGAFSLEMDDWD